nr:tartrate-resistant acid phosphatase type 5-like [Ciona intestinalis]|eukprot:XP_002121342.3 tartrate-resistant acid phosphatase type 5-like [Ciona intestinalis]
MKYLVIVTSLLVAVSAEELFIPSADGSTSTNIPVKLNQESMHFMIAGDFGGWPPPFYTTPTQWTVAEAMGQAAEKLKPNFVLAMGDNFYFLGVQDTEDERFNKTFESVYTSPYLQVPWYPTMGNHDWHGNAHAQLDYSHVSKRWTYPWYYYTLDYTLTLSSTTMRIVMMDTTIQCGIDSEGVPINATVAEEQWAWVEQQLKDGQDFDYLVVVGHFPVLAAGNTGPTNECLFNRLQPLLEEYGVSAYIAGHEHNLQHLQDSRENSNVEYFVVGCSNFVSPRFPNADAPQFNTNFAWAEMTDLGGCYGRVEVTSTSMKMVFVQGRDGADIYSYDVPPRPKQ